MWLVRIVMYSSGECGNKECPFLHIDPEKKMKVCPWYDRGFCRHGAMCKNRHVRRVMCVNYLCGFCLDGPTCKYVQWVYFLIDVDFVWMDQFSKFIFSWYNYFNPLNSRLIFGTHVTLCGSHQIIIFPWHYINFCYAISPHQIIFKVTNCCDPSRQ